MEFINRITQADVFDQIISKLHIQGISNVVKTVSYLGTGEKLAFTKSKTGLSIELTSVKPDEDVTVIAVVLAGKPITDKRPHQFESNKMVIPAWSFEIKGTGAKMLFDGFEKIAHISNWANADDYITCSFVTDHPGKFSVSVKYCSDSAAAGSSATITINQQALNFVSGNTGGFTGNNYQVKDAGIIAISNTGEQRITITPVKQGWKNMAIKEVVLIPVK